MKVVTLAQLREMPKGTVFTKYVDDLTQIGMLVLRVYCGKSSLAPEDFHYLPLGGSFGDAISNDEVRRKLESGEDVPLTAATSHSWLVCGESTQFIVFSEDDLKVIFGDCGRSV